MSNLVFPQRNLPPLSEDWGRSLEGLVRENTNTVHDRRLQVQAEDMYLAGQLGVVGRNLEGIQQVSDGIVDSANALQQTANDLQQTANDLQQASNNLQQASNNLQDVSNKRLESFEELQTRSTFRIPVANLTNTVNPPVTPSQTNFNNSRSIPIPAPLDGKDREAILYVNASSILSPVNMSFARMWVSLIVGGREVRSTIDPAPATSIPAGFRIPFSATIGFPLSGFGNTATFMYSGYAFRISGAPSGNRTVGFTDFEVYVVIGDER